MDVRADADATHDDDGSCTRPARRLIVLKDGGSAVARQSVLKIFHEEASGLVDRAGSALIQILQPAVRRVPNAAGSSPFGEQAEGLM